MRTRLVRALPAMAILALWLSAAAGAYANGWQVLEKAPWYEQVPVLAIFVAMFIVALLPLVAVVVGLVLLVRFLLRRRRGAARESEEQE